MPCPYFALDSSLQAGNLPRIYKMTSQGDLGDNHETTRQVRPLITPDAFTGETSVSYDEWIGHFENVAKVLSVFL